MRLFLLPLLAVSLAACQPSQQPIEIMDVQMVAKGDHPTSSSVSSASRFGYETSLQPDQQATSTQPAFEHGDLSASLAWTIPPDWTEISSTELRHPNFSIQGAPETQVYVTVLPGSGGGIEANLNRWRAQMSHPPLSPKEVEQLPQLTVLGQPTRVIDITGEFMGMSGEAKQDWRMLGAALEVRGQAIFIKMIGPAADVKKQKDHYFDFIRSLSQRHPPVQ